MNIVNLRLEYYYLCSMHSSALCVKTLTSTVIQLIIVLVKKNQNNKIQIEYF